MTNARLVLGADLGEEDLLEDLAVAEVVEATVGELPAALAAAVDDLLARNLFGEADRIAARASSAGTRRQYAAIYRAFGDWLTGQLGRPPVVGDLDTDVIAAYGRYLAKEGGRGGRPAAPATSRAYMSVVRALARQLGRDDAIADVRAPRQEPGPPETLTDSDYANLIRVPRPSLPRRQTRLCTPSSPWRLRSAIC
jgi:integrase